MVRKPLQVTTPTHAMGLAAYAVNAYLAVEYLLDLAHPIAMVHRIGEAPTDLWSALFLLSAVTALCAAYSASKEPDPSRSLLFEGAGALGVGVASILYVWSVVSFYGWNAQPITQAYAMLFSLGGIARAAQCANDVRKIRAAKRHPTHATPPPLAESDTAGR